MTVAIQESLDSLEQDSLATLARAHIVVSLGTQVQVAIAAIPVNQPIVDNRGRAVIQATVLTADFLGKAVTLDRAHTAEFLGLVGTQARVHIAACLVKAHIRVSLLTVARVVTRE